jgi:hypothetical protein
MKRITAVLGLLFSIHTAFGQTGLWQLTLTSRGTKETGTGFVQINDGGTFTGYSLTTLTFGVATFNGTWAASGKNVISLAFTESLNGTEMTASFYGKYSAKSLSGTITYQNGATGKVKGIPAGSLPSPVGSWSGVAKQNHENVPETFNVTQDPTYRAVFDISGLLANQYTATGQVIVTSQGKVTGYSITQPGGANLAAYFTGTIKNNTLTTKGAGTDGTKISGKFTE